MRPTVSRRLSLAALLLFVLLCAALAGAKYFPSSTTYYPVTATADSGPGSLRAAIAAAGDGDVVYFVPALNGQTINLTSGELAINSNITIQGGNAITVKGSSFSFRVFHVFPGHTVTIQGLTLKDGGGNGAKVRNDGSTLNLLNCTLTGEGGDAGGAIYNDGSTGTATLTIIDCIISGNHVRNAGGGIYNNGSGGTAIVSMWNTRVTGNTAQSSGMIFGVGDGGGIYNDGAGARMALTNCVVSGNTSGLNVLQPGGSGGGIYNRGTLTIIGSTIADNRTQIYGGGIFSFGPLAIINSTVSGNQALGTHDAGPVGYGGGIDCRSGPAPTITNSTLSNNYATNSGGGIFGGGTITHCTISGNRIQSFGSGSGGGIYVAGILNAAHAVEVAVRSGIDTRINALRNPAQVIPQQPIQTKVGLGGHFRSCLFFGCDSLHFL